MSNSISFVGRLGGDAELKQVGESQVLEFSIANNVGFGDRQTTNWFRCSIWGRRAQSLEHHLVKGKELFVTGELTMRPFTGRDGQEKMSANIRVNEVDFVGGGSGAGGNSGGGYGGGGGRQTQSAPQAAPRVESPENDDEMPF